MHKYVGLYLQIILKNPMPVPCTLYLLSKILSDERSQLHDPQFHTIMKTIYDLKGRVGP